MEFLLNFVSWSAQLKLQIRAGISEYSFGNVFSGTENLHTGFQSHEEGTK